MGIFIPQTFNTHLFKSSSFASIQALLNPYFYAMMTFFRRYSLEFFILLAIILYSFKAGNEAEILSDQDPPFNSVESPWADSLIKTLSDEQKIAQLFMVAAYSNRNGEHEEELSNLIDNYGIGGLIFFQGGPKRQAILCNKLQEKSEVPLLIGMDAEWGLAMRLDSTVKYPWQMTLGAIQDETLIYEMGRQIGEQMNRLGVHVNFAPVVDVNVNPNNPVINARSFGEDRNNVSSKGIAYMKGLQSMHVLANAKHFPGHGDTDKDSHKTLPIVNHKYNRLDSVEIYPFRQLMDQGLSSVMVAHLYIPELVKEFNKPSTLSPEIVNGLLKDSLKFEGLIFTDALNMKGVSSFYKPGEVDLLALLAGNDVMLFSEDVPKAITEIKKAIKEERISMEEIEKRCLKVLRAKEWAGLDKYAPVEINNLYEDLNQPTYELLNRKLTESSITLLQNNDDLLPVKTLDTFRIAALAVGDEGFKTFHHYLSLYTQVDTFHIGIDHEVKDQKELLEKLEKYNLIIASVHTGNRNPYSRKKINGNAADLLNAIRLKKDVVLSAFCNPYALNEFHGLDHFESFIMAYQNNAYANEMAAKLIFGGGIVNGKLPVSINPQFQGGSGLELNEVIRLNYVWPEEIGIERNWLDQIDSIAIEGLIEQAYPGCQIVVASQGKVFYNKTFGYHTYDSARLVLSQDIYDLASVTKISATLLGIMKLVEEGEVDLDYSLCDYLPDLVDTTDYANLSIREILAHQAGLKAWIPFYKKSLSGGKPRYDVYSLDSTSLYRYRVANNLYINYTYRDSIFDQILKTPVNESGEYKYSDIGYYFLKEIVETKTGQELDKYVEKEFYQPLGMSRTGFKPLYHFRKEEIVPTENDKMFRGQLIHGDVHDPGAAMLGGVGGHAGLFGNANDIAKLMQMYVSSGSYAGREYLNSETVKEFTSCQYCENENRRGAGFDKPMINGEEGGPTCTCVSYMSFGHSGFTGTYAWADPEDEIVYVFLSNRIHPDASNKKLISLSIRTRIQEVIYDAIAKRHSKELLSDTIKH